MVITKIENAGTELGGKLMRVCPKCKIVVDTRVPRGRLFKLFFFFLPVKRYLCYKCQRKTYFWS